MKDKDGQSKIFLCMGIDYPFSLEDLGNQLERLKTKCRGAMSETYIFSNEVLFDIIAGTEGYNYISRQTVNRMVEQETQDYIKKTCDILEMAAEQKKAVLFERAIRNLLFLGTNTPLMRPARGISLEKFSIGFSSMRLICEETLEQITHTPDFTAKQLIRFINNIDGLPITRQSWEKEQVEGERIFFGLLPKTQSVLRDQAVTADECMDAVLIYSFALTALVFNLEVRRNA